MAYYNEIDPYAARWLRNLIAAGHIAPGDVEDVRPDDLAGYRQCHFFAGIGVWSYALRRARVADDAPVWTGSCPCQPFSQAGDGDGMDDERHLWPAFFHLIRERRPAKIIGEQVASKDAEPWLDLVCDDLGSLGYACGAVAFPSAGVGAPHVRDRLYWVANASTRGLHGIERRRSALQFADGCAIGGLGDADHAGSQGHAGHGSAEGRSGPARPAAPAGVSGQLADADGRNAGAEGLQRGGQHGQQQEDGRSGGMADTAGAGRRPERQNRDTAHSAEAIRPGQAQSGRRGAIDRPGPLNGFWRAADWLLCRDGRWRPVEPGTQPLAHGATARVGRLRAYGNAINAEAAVAFIEAMTEAVCCPPPPPSSATSEAARKPASKSWL
jgi:DNA (cytosine-5)-methyltransferase 1